MNLPSEFPWLTYTKIRPSLAKTLAPNRRPVQVATNLSDFWETTYPNIKKELRGRYPKVD